ncbi:NUDIX hydrolase [Sutcliffiella halmapala]|uniref:NUDIX hydrolase n=1 Tax=Sutcliffiella halmapala TaxID=79882 RepID=UPI000994B7D8|nr:NUDIX domain-containing protein [Sutcliffiella halmapala]
MESEKLKIFDEYRNFLGVATRAEVHKVGHWHETFHCWVVSREEDGDYIYFQLRSPIKKDYPNLLDITAAGHLLANETVEDGIREVREEIGLEVTIGELHSLGIIPYSNQQGDLIDKELAHAFLLIRNCEMEDFQLQLEEVVGIVKIRLDDCRELWSGTKETIFISGFNITAAGEHIKVKKAVTKEAFVPHEDHFYIETFNIIKSAIESRS